MRSEVYQCRRDFSDGVRASFVLLRFLQVRYFSNYLVRDVEKVVTISAFSVSGASNDLAHEAEEFIIPVTSAIPHIEAEYAEHSSG